MALILIVEDEIFIRQNAEWMMEDLGHDTLVACDLGEALVHLSAAVPIDALFVDMRLSALAFGGLEVANQGVALQPAQFVPGGRFIQKPYSPEQLGISIDQLLN